MVGGVAVICEISVSFDADCGVRVVRLGVDVVLLKPYAPSATRLRLARICATFRGMDRRSFRVRHSFKIPYVPLPMLAALAIFFASARLQVAWLGRPMMIAVIIKCNGLFI